MKKNDYVVIRNWNGDPTSIYNDLCGTIVYIGKNGVDVELDEPIQYTRRVYCYYSEIVKVGEVVVIE